MYPRLLNLKLTRGDRLGAIEPHEIWDELFSIARQRAEGLKPCGPTHSSRPQVDVRQLVASL